VVITLITLLLVTIYYVFLNNLFASVKLFRVLQSKEIRATGTYCKDCRINKILKDNALVLFLTTVYYKTEEVLQNRQQPAGSSTAYQAAYKVFRPNAYKQLPIPLGINKYNYNINSVDTGD
ncbi:hypothetical protein LZ30DRAFT_790129, partial [Colletotrichum cereale]